VCVVADGVDGAEYALAGVARVFDTDGRGADAVFVVVARTGG
jgi:hypothetical protein